MDEVHSGDRAGSKWRLKVFFAFFAFRPQVPVVSWFDDLEDTELLTLLPVFEELSEAENVYAKLQQMRTP